jgi:hypothetical protein
MDTNELAWASGLFDGEGCISIGRNRGSLMAYPNMTMAMQDQDAVLRFHAAVGVGTVGVRPPHGTNQRALYTWRADSFENTQAVIALLWYGLNARRKARAREVLTLARESQSLRRYMRRGDSCSLCDSPVLARGLCSKHYQAARRSA